MGRSHRSQQPTQMMAGRGGTAGSEADDGVAGGESGGEGEGEVPLREVHEQVAQTRRRIFAMPSVTQQAGRMQSRRWPAGTLENC